ncbi:hypothetical protein A7E78_12415 [Syntrophotalea acetylenivorans]|uniref:Uncharacterized protein n=1 Tax=Syntrophotalea acetylenivorans TaxID=1842532 RepID=A0A1L3GRK1_9BACT|nr:hypothetical protein A7E78_12415 [Syntrophotalea acetylenivorans]
MVACLLFKMNSNRRFFGFRFQSTRSAGWFKTTGVPYYAFGKAGQVFNQYIGKAQPEESGEPFIGLMFCNL